MNIKTKEIKLTKSSYFNLLAKKYFRQKWWVFALLGLIALSTLINDDRQTSDYFTIGVAFAYPAYILIYFRRFCYSKENKVFLLSRHYQFNDEDVEGYFEDGTKSQIRLAHVTKIYRAKNYALIYLSKITMLYMPEEAFDSEHTYHQLLAYIESKISR